VELTVGFAKLKAGSYTKNPDDYVEKLTYRVGEPFQRDSVGVSALYSDKSRRSLTDYEVEGFDSSKPGIIWVRFKRNGKYAEKYVYDNENETSFPMTILAESGPRLFFDYGRRISAADTPPGRYTVTEGRTLVIAPVCWRIPEGATWQWTVSPSADTSFDGEFLTFKSGTGAELYTVTVTASFAGGTASASTTVECVNPSSFPSPVTVSGIDRVWAPGQFVPGAPRENIISLGGYGGYDINAISIDNGAGDDIRIEGNAFGDWCEPGVIWVMADENHNGEADDTWYELKGNAEELPGIKVNRRYTVTFYKSGASNIYHGGAWEDSLGNYGTCGSEQWYPYGYPDPITFCGTNIDTSDYHDHMGYLRGYVDAQDNLYDISDAIQVDGTAANLSHIDFVKVHTGKHQYTGSFGEISTELTGLGRVWDERRSLTGTGNGSGGYIYRFVNTSGYAITVSFKDGPAAITVAASGGEGTLTWTASTLYFNYSGGNVSFSVSGNTVTFKTK
jgi:hypothetical protein